MHADQRTALWLAVCLAALFLLFSEGAISGSDGEAMFQTTRSAVVERNLSIAPELGIRGHDGHYYTRLGLGLPLLSVPIFVAGAAVGHVVGHSFEIEHAFVASLMPLICALLGASVFLWCRRLGGSQKSSVIVAIGTLVGTFALAYTKEFFSEPLAALGLVVCLERLEARRFAFASGGLAVAVLTRPQLVVLVPFYLLLCFRKGGRNAVLLAAPGIAFTGVLTAVYNQLRFDSILRFGYQDFGFEPPQTAAMRAFLWSPTKSLPLFAPIVLALAFSVYALRKRNVDAAIAIAAVFAGVVLVTVCVDFWGGGWSWGPRYLLLTIFPAAGSFAVWLDGSRRRLRITYGLMLLGFLISASTLIVSTRAQQLDRTPGTSPNPVRQVLLLEPTLEYTSAHMYETQRPEGTYYRAVTTWQIGATRLLGRRGLFVAIAGSAALVAAAIMSARAVRRLVCTDE